MADDQKIREIVDLLLDKTRKGDITWSSTLPDGAFMTSFPKHSVRIQPDKYSSAVILSVYNDSGTIFSEISERRSEKELPANTTGLAERLNHFVFGAKLSELYSLVRQSREDAEFTDLLKELREAS